MILVPDLGLHPSVVDNGIETRSELDPKAESINGQMRGKIFVFFRKRVVYLT